MIIEFSVGNYASFKDPVTLSLVAARSIKSRNRVLDAENLIPVDAELSLLVSTVVYGPNAGGKSNLIKASAFMCDFVRTSFRELPAGAAINVQPFRLSTQTVGGPSTFEMVFLIEGRQFRYGFSVNSQKVEREWLFMIPKTKEIALFEREGQAIRPNPSNAHAREFRAILSLLGRINSQEPLRSNALFLSVAAQNNGALARQVTDWFTNLRFMSGLDDLGYRGFTIQQFKDVEQQARINDLVHRLDVGIDLIEMVPIDRDEALKGAPGPLRELFERMGKSETVSFRSHHQVYDEQGKPIQSTTFDLLQNESDGTQKLFFMAGPILDALANGRVLWVDEMEARLHPNLTGALVGLFNSRASNPKRAQLIFTTHDTNLLDLRKMRRDQIWFIDKDKTAASRLYSLVEFKIRNDNSSLEDDYIHGIYGATPHLGELAAAFDQDDA
ncbi:MAG: ATP-binding protein [Chloroflexi bacterium]|nr:ATP-binding protein [Chloroflexota bacterium]